MPRPIPRCSGADHLRCAEDIEAGRVLGTRNFLRCPQPGKRDHGLVIVPNIELLDAALITAILSFRFEKYPPLPTEAVELVQKETSQISLKCLIYICDRYALLQDLVAVNFRIDLRN